MINKLIEKLKTNAPIVVGRSDAELHPKAYPG